MEEVSSDVKVAMMSFPEFTEGGFIEACKRVVQSKTAHRFQNVFVDLTTANVVVTIHGALSDSNKKKLEAMEIGRAVHVCYQLLKK